MTSADCRQRAGTAREHLTVARERLLAAEAAPGPSEVAQVAASNAVLAGIAAADAICGTALGETSGEQDHRAAIAQLKRVAASGPLVTKLTRLLADKTALQYGGYCTHETARRAVDQATVLVDALRSHHL
ncbi:hypothetical protein TEK04_13950 [Klenkia sp. LSe6-5]|uniref:HEPN domain-containing protein n=1 Tax=Klenkia sesuvii TaxID=3103137 RepID=A0ABU8DVY2_9ACTN